MLKPGRFCFFHQSMKALTYGFQCVVNIFRKSYTVRLVYILLIKLHDASSSTSKAFILQLMHVLICCRNLKPIKR